MTTLDDLLRPHGFRRRRGKTWKRRTETGVQIVDLARYDHDPECFVMDVALWISELADAAPALDHYGHIRIRADHLGGGSSVELLRAVAADEQRRAEQLREFVEERLVPFFDAATTVEGLRGLSDSGIYENAFVHKVAKPLLKPSPGASAQAS